MALSQDSFNRIDSEFQEQSSFTKVLFKSFKHDRVKLKHIISHLIVFIVIACASYPVASTNNSKDVFSSLLDIGLNLSIGILGFLIAGFSIYATMTDKNFVYILILTRDKDTDINQYLKNYLIFFKPFALFLLLLFISVCTRFALNIWASIAFNNKLQLFSNSEYYYNIFISVLFALYFFLLLLSVNSLKIFIFNIYESTKAIGRLELYNRQGILNKYIEHITETQTATKDTSDNS